MAREKKLTETKCLRMRLSDSEAEAIQKQADALGMKPSALVRLLLSVPLEIGLYRDGEALTVERKPILLCHEGEIKRLNNLIQSYGTLCNQGIRSLNTIAARDNIKSWETDQLIKSAQETLYDVLNGLGDISGNVRKVTVMIQDAPKVLVVEKGN